MVQNLKDAGCGPDKILAVCRLCEGGQIQDAIRLLRQHRCGLMDHLHQSQSRVDCLDYLVCRMEKELESTKGLQM